MTRVQLHRGPPPNATLSLAQLEQGFFGETGAVTTGVAFGVDVGGFAETALLTQTGLTQSAKVLNYITALPNQSSHRVIVGQQWAEGGGSGEPNPPGGTNSDPLVGVKQLQTDTGKMTGIFGIDLGTSYGDYLAQYMVPACTAAWGTYGQLMTAIWNPKNPVTGGDETDTTAAIHQAVTSGTSANTEYLGQLSSLATRLNQIKAAMPGIVILFRPFREENLTSFWWANASTADFTALWTIARNYLNGTAGLGGMLLWDYNVYATVGNYTKNYPGASLVDVVSFDYYGDNPATDCNTTYNNLRTLNKPIRWAEFGAHNASGPITANSFDNTVVLNAVKNSFPQLFSVSCWHGWWAWDTQLNASTLMNDAIVATAADVHATTRFA